MPCLRVAFEWEEVARLVVGGMGGQGVKDVRRRCSCGQAAYIASSSWCSFQDGGMNRVYRIIEQAVAR